MKKIFQLLLLFSAASLFSAPRLRPEKWATPIIGAKLDNWYKLDDKLYRSAQPDKGEFEEVEKFGIKTILNMRNFHTDDDEAEETKLTLCRVPVDAGKITIEEIEKSLAFIKKSKGPVLVHCWHGSDRTGTICAAYRIVFQNWSVADAIDEMKNGGYGFHTIYKNIPKTIENIDWKAVKERVQKAQLVQ